MIALYIVKASAIRINSMLWKILNLILPTEAVKMSGIIPIKISIMYIKVESEGLYMHRPKANPTRSGSNVW